MSRAFIGLSVLLVLVTGAPVRAIPPPPPDDVRIVRVLDGHTLIVTPYGDPYKVRLACIHTPQLHRGSAGLAAKAALEKLLQPGAWVTLSNRSKATDGVALAEILPHGSTVPVNLTLVQEGLAVMDHQTGSPCAQASYREAEMDAKSRKLGLWRPAP